MRFDRKHTGLQNMLWEHFCQHETPFMNSLPIENQIIFQHTEVSIKYIKGSPIQYYTAPQLQYSTTASPSLPQRPTEDSIARAMSPIFFPSLSAATTASRAFLFRRIRVYAWSTAHRAWLETCTPVQYRTQYSM